jgi:hypothetical protein
MALIPTDQHERLAIACVSGLVGAHNGGRLGPDEALAEIADQWPRWKVTPERVPFVLAAELRHWLDDRYYADRARALLIAAGADPGLAERMRAEDPRAARAFPRG